MFKAGLFLLVILFGLKNADAQTAAAYVDANHLSTIALLQVPGNTTTTLNTSNKPLSLFVFLSPECPLSQNYTKVVNALAVQHQKTVSVYGIVPGDAYTSEEVAAFKRKYELTFPVFIDPQQKLTGRLQATITPQAILVNANESMLYSGAIDNWVVALGKKRAHVTEHYVANAIEQSLQKKPVVVQTTVAIGCRINDY